MVKQWISRSTARVQAKLFRENALTSENWEYLQCLLSTMFRTVSTTSWYKHLASLTRTISNSSNQSVSSDKHSGRSSLELYERNSPS